MVAGGISMAIASIASWFTPTVLFCTTNLIIATIFIASKTTTNNHHHHHHHHLHGDSLTPISRVSSFLRRTTSLNLSSTTTTTAVATTAEPHYQPPIQPETATYSSSSRLAQSIYESPPPESETQPLSQLVRTPSLLDRVRSFRISSFVSTQSETVDPDPSHDSEYYVIGSKSEKKSSKKKKSSVEMKKSRSEMRIAQKEEDDDDDVDARRPATARERRSDDGDDEVDARADDFISRFKQQLKLQRLESLVRYNEMLNRRR